jgi:Putative Actinobacterial Holin-X, holin superfamily III
MEPANTPHRRGEPAVVGGESPDVSGLPQAITTLWVQLRELVHEQLTLAALETRLAGQSLLTMIAAGLGIAVLLITAWVGLMGAAVLWLNSIGVIASIAILITVAANLGFALILYQLIRRRSRHLQFSATQRSLRSMLSKRRAPEKA